MFSRFRGKPNVDKEAKTAQQKAEDARENRHRWELTGNQDNRDALAKSSAQNWVNAERDKRKKKREGLGAAASALGKAAGEYGRSVGDSARAQLGKAQAHGSIYGDAKKKKVGVLKNAAGERFGELRGIVGRKIAGEPKPKKSGLGLWGGKRRRTKRRRKSRKRKTKRRRRRRR